MLEVVGFVAHFAVMALVWLFGKAATQFRVTTSNDAEAQAKWQKEEAQRQQDEKDNKTSIYLSRVAIAESTMPFLAAAAISVTVTNIISAGKS